MKVNVLAETRTTITLGWVLMPGQEGYAPTIDGSELLTDGKRHPSTSQTTNNVKIGKPADETNPATKHRYGVKILGVTDSGEYDPTTPSNPNPPDPEPTPPAFLFDGRFGNGPQEWSPWDGVLEDTTQPTQSPTYFGDFLIHNEADGSRSGRFVIDGTNDATVTKERVQILRKLPGTPAEVQWFGFDFWLDPAYPTNSIFTQALWQANVGTAAPPANALQAILKVKGLLMVVQAGVAGSSVPGTYEFKSVYDPSSPSTTPPGQLWAIPQGSLELGTWYQLKYGINWSTRSPRNPQNQGAPDGWAKCYWRKVGGAWAKSFDVSGFATVRVGLDGAVPSAPQQTVEIYDLNHRPTRREMRSHGLFVCPTEHDVDKVFG